MVPDGGRRAATSCSACRSAAAPAQVSDFTGDIGGFKLSPAGDRVVVWADRDLRLRRPRLRRTAQPSRRPASGRTYDQLFVRHWDTWAEPGVALAAVRLPDRRTARLTGGGRSADRPASSATRRPSRSAAARSSPSRPTAGPLYFALREAGRIEPMSTNLDIFAVPERRQRPAGQPDRRQRRDRQSAGRVARRPDARLFRDGAADLRGRPPGADAARHRPGHDAAR